MRLCKGAAIANGVRRMVRQDVGTAYERATGGAKSHLVATSLRQRELRLEAQMQQLRAQCYPARRYARIALHAPKKNGPVRIEKTTLLVTNRVPPAVAACCQPTPGEGPV